MPLTPGSSQKIISQNIGELTQHGSRKRSHKQIVAIALSMARKMKSQSQPRRSGDSDGDHDVKVLG